MKAIMGSSCSLIIRVFLVLALLLLSSSNGLGRKVIKNSVDVQEVSIGKAKEMMHIVMDYELEPEPNTNPKGAIVVPIAPSPHG